MISYPVLDYNAVEDQLQELRGEEGRLLTNCYLDGQEIERLVDSGRMHCEYEEGSYINLYCRDAGFSKVYYYIAAPDRYRAEADETLVADIFYRESARGNRIEDTVRMMEDAGFATTDHYARWSRSIDESELGTAADEIGFEADDQMVDVLYRCFDPYKDCLPLKEDLPRYLEEHSIIRYPADGDFAGGVISKKSGSVVTVEYIYVAPEMRGKRIGSYLFEQLVKTSFKQGESGRLVGWINDQNKASIALHISNGFKKDAMRKIVMKKG